MVNDKVNKSKYRVLFGGVLLASLLIVAPVQASTLSQSQTVTVTGGHFYTYTYWQEVQTGTQQVQTGTNNTYYTCSITDAFSSSTSGGVITDNCPTGSSLTEVGYQQWWSNTVTDSWGDLAEPNGTYESIAFSGNMSANQYYVSTPVYTTEPVYTNEQFTGTAWSPAIITTS